MSDKQQRIFQAILDLLQLPEIDVHNIERLAKEGLQSASQPPAVKGAVWVKCSKRLPDIDNVHDDPTEYIMRCENDGSRGSVHIIQATALEMREVVREWDYCEWLDETPTAAGDAASEKELELARAHFKIKAEQVGYWHQAYEVLKSALLKVRKGANGVDLAVIDEALNREIKATAAGDGKEEKAFAEWLEENTEIIRDNPKVTLYRYCDKMNEWGNYTLDDIYTVYKDL